MKLIIHTRHADLADDFSQIVEAKIEIHSALKILLEKVLVLLHRFLGRRKHFCTLGRFWRRSRCNWLRPKESY